MDFDQINDSDSEFYEINHDEVDFDQINHSDADMLGDGVFENGLSDGDVCNNEESEFDVILPILNDLVDQNHQKKTSSEFDFTKIHLIHKNSTPFIKIIGS